MKRTVRWFLILALAATTATAQDNLAKGKLALSTRDTAAAIESFAAALKAGQRPAESSYYLGAIAYAQRRYDDAQRYLEESVKFDDENVDALSTLARVYVYKKNTTAALAAYHKTQKYAAKNASIATGYGMALLSVDSVDAAIVQLTRAKDLDGNNAEVYAALGQAYLKQNVPPMSVTNYQRAIELSPKQYLYRDSLASVYLRMKNYKDAVAQYDTIAMSDTTNVEPLLDIGRILSKAVGQQKVLAVHPLERYLLKNPKSVEGLTLLTQIYFQLEYYDSAAAVGSRAIAVDPKNPELYREMGKSLIEKFQKDYKGAVAAYEKVKAMNAFKPEDHAGYGAALAGVGGHDDDAMAELLAAVKADSTNCDPYFPLGSLYMTKKDYTTAATWFEKKIACDPKSLSSYLNASLCYWQLKDWEKIRSLLDRALALKPDYLTTRLWLARYFVQTDSLENANEEYDIVIREGSANLDKYKKEVGEAYMMKASYEFTKQRYQASIDNLRKALGVGYENSALHLTWGQAVLQTLDPKESAEEGKAKKQDAVNHFRKSIALDQTNAVAHLWLAQGLILLRVPGEDQLNKQLQEEACSEYKKTLRLQPNNADAKKGMDLYGCK